MWLIGDTEERPGQTRCTREGSLCQWACPHCGHQGGEGAPILLCRPEEDPRLLYSPAQETSQERDRERAAALVGQLCEELDNEWQDALGDRAGCDVFVGPSWSVNDLWAYQSGNPAWLSYGVYAHPNARVVFGPQDAT